MSKSLKELLGELAGEASMCWTEVDKAGVFDSNNASKAVDTALKEIKQLWLSEGELEKLTLDWLSDVDDAHLNSENEHSHFTLTQILKCDLAKAIRVAQELKAGGASYKSPFSTTAEAEAS